MGRGCGLQGSHPHPADTLFCLSLLMQSMSAGYPPEKRHRCTVKRVLGWEEEQQPKIPPKSLILAAEVPGETTCPHLPGPARRTMCSSCPPGHRGSRGLSGAWAVPPLCGGTEGGSGVGAAPSQCPSLPSQGLPKQDLVQPGRCIHFTGRETEAQNRDTDPPRSSRSSAQALPPLSLQNSTPTSRWDAGKPPQCAHVSLL